MSEQAATETHSFQAEVKQLLHLMIHSLYSNKEIFLRELISNAADACDRLRFEALKDAALLQSDPELVILVTIDTDAGTLAIEDNGVGMSREEIVTNLGTIARSGTREFLERLSGDDKKDANLIGQFGVGFYSSFIVADKVTVDSVRAGESTGVRWESQGDGEYTLATSDRSRRGTQITLHLRDDEKEFLDRYRIRNTVKKYSDHIAIPVKLVSEGDAGEVELETINDSSALWRRPRSEISDEQYIEFYRYIAHDQEAPLAWTHNRVEGKTEYISLLYLPSQPTFDLWDRDHARGVKLFVKRVFIMDEAQDLLPNYLRFVRGVIDADDLPLNVSREILQSNRIVDSIRAGSVKKILATLTRMAKEENGDYAKFWSAFGSVLKEGIMEDVGNQKTIAGLLRFASTTSEGDEQSVSLDDYVARMKPDQKAIHYLLADDLHKGRKSPHLEGLIATGHEVLILTEPLDEWLVAHLPAFDDKPLHSAAHGDVDDRRADAADAALDEQYRDVAARMGSLLKDHVGDVRVSKRLVDSPACVVAQEGDLGAHVKRMLRDAGQDVPENKPALEINPTHPLIIRLANLEDKDAFRGWTTMVYEQAVLAAGGHLDDPVGFVKRVNNVILGTGVGD